MTKPTKAKALNALYKIFNNQPFGEYFMAVRDYIEAQPENVEPVVRLHVSETDSYLYARAEVLDGSNLQPAGSPYDLYLSPVGSSGESFDAIAAWCEETFGPITIKRTVSRAGEEFDELTEAVSAYSHDDLTDAVTLQKVVEEAADVIICLSRLPGLQEAIGKKMAVNRARKWNLRGDGTGYHVKVAPERLPDTVNEYMRETMPAGKALP